MSLQHSSGGRFHHRGPPPIRKNDRIRAREVRLIGPDGKQIGVATREDALALAQRYGLDLVEIAPSAKPPVCRILDFGKYMYEQSKRSKDKSPVSKVKIVKFRVRIEEHDYMTKLRHSEEFLYKGNKLKIALQFRGREMEHTELGMALVHRAIRDLEHVGHPDGDPKLSGRNIFASMSPIPLAKRRLKFNEKLSEEELQDDSDEEDEKEEAEADRT